MRVMHDTNVIISAGLYGGGTLSRTTFKIAEKYSLVLSSIVIDELRMVMEEKFPDKVSTMDCFLQKLSYEVSYTPTNINNDVFPKIRDKKDYPVLASAIIADVDVFITGDKDFNVLDIDRPEILTISDFFVLKEHFGRIRLN